MGVRVEGASREEAPEDNTGKPDLPYGVPGEPQRVEGARSNTPPTAFCFESSTVNTGEPARDVKEGGE